MMLNLRNKEAKAFRFYLLRNYIGIKSAKIFVEVNIFCFFKNFKTEQI